MTEIKDNTLPIEIPVKRVRLTYRANWGIVLVLSFWTLFFALFFSGLVLYASYYPIKRLWNDWVISKNYEVIPNAYAAYGCNEYEDILDYANCRVTFNAGNRYKEEKLRDGFENFPYSWQVFLAPENLAMKGKSPMVRSVDNPGRTSFLFGIETIKIRLLSLLITKAFQILIVSVWFYGLYLWWKVYYWRRFPNDVCLKAIKIARIYDAKKRGKVYYHYGLSKSIAASGLRYLPSPNYIVMPNPMRNMMAYTWLRKGQEPIFLNKEQTIGVAIEAKQAGGGYLLDYNLTRCVLSKQDKEKLIANIKAYQAWIAKHPKELQELKAAIERQPKTGLIA
ncbi:hypothetical protein [Bartonella sp. HY038]|uniref:hypothetical protein n=1 Tax=Bartonella sp. HY038 TaxID=2759660 RepID=UPI0015F7BE24|nr:hypothetical protein [Bartonella sp. HY038]